MAGQVIALGACYAHGALFRFDPERVATLLIDPVTGAPPDVAPDPATPDEAARFARSRQAFICPPCCRKVNEAAGHEHIAILDDTDPGTEPR